MLKNKIAIFNKGFLAILFIVAILFLRCDLKSAVSHFSSNKKVEFFSKKNSNQASLFSLGFDDDENDKFDFEENEIEELDAEASLVHFSSKTFKILVFKKVNSLYFFNTKIFFKLPYYILFCNLKLHLPK